MWMVCANQFSCFFPISSTVCIKEGAKPSLHGEAVSHRDHDLRAESCRDRGGTGPSPAYCCHPGKLVRSRICSSSLRKDAGGGKRANLRELQGARPAAGGEVRGVSSTRACFQQCLLPRALDCPGAQLTRTGGGGEALYGPSQPLHLSRSHWPLRLGYSAPRSCLLTNYDDSFL